MVHQVTSIWQMLVERQGPHLCQREDKMREKGVDWIGQGLQLGMRIDWKRCEREAGLKQLGQLQCGRMSKTDNGYFSKMNQTLQIFVNSIFNL